MIARHSLRIDLQPLSTAEQTTKADFGIDFELSPLSVAFDWAQD
jgi:hypothetical protein